MGRPTEKTIKRLFALSGNSCAFPGCVSPIVESVTSATGQICHIRARGGQGPRFDESLAEADLHSFENLILLCPNHHSVVDGQPKRFTIDVLERMKADHESKLGRSERGEDIFSARILLRELERFEANGNLGNIVVNSPGAVVTQTVIVKSARKAVRVEPPPGTIGADQEASRYVQYLISRYNKYASAEKDRARPFNFGVISRTIETKFRAPWRLLSVGDFAALSQYLQQRISKTRIGKLNAARGDRSFSSFEDFLSTCDRDG